MDDHSPTPARAGQYVTRPAGYKAFLPAPSPPRPPLRIAGELQARNRKFMYRDYVNLFSDTGSEEAA